MSIEGDGQAATRQVRAEYSGKFDVTWSMRRTQQGETDPITKIPMTSSRSLTSRNRFETITNLMIIINRILDKITIVNPTIEIETFKEKEAPLLDMRKSTTKDLRSDMSLLLTLNQPLPLENTKIF